MIELFGDYYLYRHIRKDNNQVFYIGVGGKTKADLKNNKYSRATSLNGRNIFWNRVVEKTEFIVEIILESNDRIFIIQKEIEFIKIYGRRDYDTGHLVNLTNGGEGSVGLSSYSYNNYMNTIKSNGYYDKMIARMKYYASMNGNPDRLANKKVYQYNLQGIYLKSFVSIKKCTQEIGCGETEISVSLRNKTSCKGFYFSVYYHEKLNTTIYTVRQQNHRPCIKICPKTYNILDEYRYGSEAAKSIGAGKENMFHALNKVLKCKGFYWAFKNEYEQKINNIKNKQPVIFTEERKLKIKNHLANYRKEHPEVYIREKPIINIKTGEMFNGISEIVNAVSISKRLLQRRLSDEIFNDTPFRFIHRLNKTV